MITCICHNVSDKKINKICEEKTIHSISDLKKEINICTQCKKCAPEIKTIIKEHIHQKSVDFL